MPVGCASNDTIILTICGSRVVIKHLELTSRKSVVQFDWVHKLAYHGTTYCDLFPRCSIIHYAMMVTSVGSGMGLVESHWATSFNDHTLAPLPKSRFFNAYIEFSFWI